MTDNPNPLPRSDDKRMSPNFTILNSSNSKPDKNCKIPSFQKKNSRVKKKLQKLKFSFLIPRKIYFVNGGENKNAIKRNFNLKVIFI